MPSRVALAAALLVGVSCSFGEELPGDARVECASASECPGGYECIIGVGYCTRTGTELPSLEVSFTLPRNDDVDVSLTTSEVVVFNMNVEVPSAELVSVVSENGAHVVPIVLRATESANTLLVEPQSPLFPLTRYVLTIYPGVAPRRGLLAVASKATWTAAFTTTASTDDEAPAPVTNLVTSRGDNGRFRLDFEVSASADRAGSLVLTSETGPVTDVPVKGQSYVEGQLVGTSTVVSVGISPSTEHVAPQRETQHYAVFALDSALNYSSGVQAPVAALTQAIYCPDGNGSVRIESSDVGTGQVSVAADAYASLEAGTAVPETPVAFGTSVSISPGAPFIPGTVAHLRALAHSADGAARYLGNDVPLTIGSTVAVSVANARATVTGGWDTYHVEVDSNPQGGVETYVIATAIGAEYASPTALGDGFYRFRARPVVPGCADVAWSYSDEFRIGPLRDLYVRAGATGHGEHPAAPMGSLSEAYAKAVDSMTTIRVGAGTYAGALVLNKSVAVLGGYAADFSVQEPQTYVSTVTAPANTVTVTGGNQGGGIVGLTILATNNDDTSRALVMDGGGSVQLSELTVRGPVALVVNSGLGVTFVNNTFTGTSLTSAAVQCLGSDASYIRNVFQNVPRAGTSTLSAALQVGGSCNATFTRNGIASRSTAGANCAAVHVTWGAGVFINNTMFGGTCNNSRGVWIDSPASAPVATPAGSVIVSNNTVWAGDVGIDLDAGSVNAATWTVRVTNNLFWGNATSAVALDEGFRTLASFQNNATNKSPTMQIFCYRPRSSSMSCSVASDGSALGCMYGVVTSGNTYGSQTPNNVFVSTGGLDSNTSTLADNDWSLMNAASAAIRTGGLTLGSGLNCGGASCSDLTPTAACGNVTTDMANAPRTAPYSVGAYEKN